MVDNDLLGAILAGWVSGFGLAILLAFLSLYFIRRYSIPMLTSEVSVVVKFVVAANIFVLCNSLIGIGASVLIHQYGYMSVNYSVFMLFFVVATGLFSSLTRNLSLAFLAMVSTCLVLAVMTLSISSLIHLWGTA
tara:strand:+ start:5702 stop:6106 length:405 start_codon:yes stop_codon:yes gene_type:complete